MEDRKKVYLFAVEEREQQITPSELESIIRKIVPDFDFKQEVEVFLDEQLEKKVLNEKYGRWDNVLNVWITATKGGAVSFPHKWIQDLLGVEKKGVCYNDIITSLNNLVEGRGELATLLSKDGIDLSNGTRLIISKGEYEEPIGTEGLFSNPRHSKRDVWLYYIRRFSEEKPWSAELDINRQSYEADKLNLLEILKPISRTRQEKVSFSGKSRLTFDQILNLVYEGPYLAFKQTVDLKDKMLEIEGIKFSDIGNNKKLEVVEKIEQLYKEMIGMAVAYGASGVSSDLLTKAGQCLRALYHLGAKELPVNIQELRVPRTEFVWDGENLYFNLKGTQHRFVNLSGPDLKRLNPKNILFIQFEQIPEYRKIFFHPKHKAYVVNLK